MTSDSLDRAKLLKEKISTFVYGGDRAADAWETAKLIAELEAKVDSLIESLAPKAVNCWFEGDPPNGHSAWSEWFEREGSKGVLVGLRISALPSLLKTKGAPAIDKGSRERDISGTKWRCKDGQEIPISKLSDDHLSNILKMLERKFEEAKVIDPPFFQGEMASMIAEQEWLQIQTASISDVYPIYDELVREAKSRATIYPHTQDV